MGLHNLPSPSAEKRASLLKKNSSSSAKPVDSVYCRFKNVRSSAAMMHHHDHRPYSPGCDGEFPCMRCKNDSLICTAAARKKTEYKELPGGYAEVLETAQHSLIATIHKLYEMVRKGQTWELGEPDINDQGLPVAQSIALKLGCIRPEMDVDRLVHSVIPESKGDLLRLGHQLEEYSEKCRSQQQQQELVIERRLQMQQQEEVTDTQPSVYNQREPASSSEPVYSDFETYYSKQACSANTMAVSPRSLTTGFDFQFSPPPPEMNTSPPSNLNSLSWTVTPSVYPNDLTMAFSQQASMMQCGMLNKRLAESETGIIKSQGRSGLNLCAMMDMVMGEQVIYSGYDDGLMQQGPLDEEDPYSCIIPE
ncbi:hypothetical protein H9L39_19685 [Fusarium oxysporum f. sp. albedinis]|nr:hypothetical protein H9L39_19685 [Fusarium oxysporum f. sp. albedinis]